MTENDLLEHAVASFGSTPGDDLRDELHREAQRHPETVRATINRITDAYHAGTVTSPWGILRSELRKLANVAPKAKASNDRARAQQRAEQWMRAAGLHMPTWNEAHDELFGDRGQLAPWPDLADHMQQLYLEHRPTGERLDQEQIDRAERWKHQTAAAVAARPPTPQPQT